MKNLVAATAAAALALGVLSVTGQAAAAAPTPQQLAEKAAKGVAWKACTNGLEAYQKESYPTADYPSLSLVQCGTLTVPLDHKRPHGRKIKLALSRLAHSGPDSGFKGILAVNPGGPGAPGTDFAVDFAAGLTADLQKSYDVIGFDPRGVGGSEPSLHCNDAYFKPVRRDYVPRSAKDEKAWLRKAAGYSAACAKKYGSFLKHTKSTDWARDLDRIRGALGQPKLNFYGASYGTYLGAVYATLFPRRTGRFVLDSNVQPSKVWYKANLAQDYAFDRNINFFLKWVAKHDDAYGLGTRYKTVKAKFYKLRASLRAHPAKDKGKPLVGPSEFDDLYGVGGYAAFTWPYLAKAFASAAKGDKASLVAYFKVWGLVTDDNTFAVYNAVQCTDTKWPQSYAKWRKDAKRVYREAPFLAWNNTWYNASCLTWPAKPGKPVNVRARAGLPDVLLVQPQYDAATPVAGGYELRKRLGGKLILEKGGLTHGAVQRGNACIDDKVNAFFATGTTPSAAFTTCAKLPDPVPLKDAARTTAVAKLPRVIR